MPFCFNTKKVGNSFSLLAHLLSLSACHQHSITWNVNGGGFFPLPLPAPPATNGRIHPSHMFSMQTRRVIPPFPQVFWHKWEELDLSVPFQPKQEGSIDYHNNKRAGILGTLTISFNFIISTNTLWALPFQLVFWAMAGTLACSICKTDPSCTSLMWISSNSLAPHHPLLLEMQDRCLTFQAMVPTMFTLQQRWGCCWNFGFFVYIIFNLYRIYHFFLRDLVQTYRTWSEVVQVQVHSPQNLPGPDLDLTIDTVPPSFCLAIWMREGFCACYGLSVAQITR